MVKKVHVIALNFELQTDRLLTSLRQSMLWRKNYMSSHRILIYMLQESRNKAFPLNLISYYDYVYYYFSLKDTFFPAMLTLNDYNGEITL